MRSILITGLLLLSACASLPKNVVVTIPVPECPGPYKEVRVIDGAISGVWLQNVIDNHLASAECIARLKALLGHK